MNTDRLFKFLGNPIRLAVNRTSGEVLRDLTYDTARGAEVDRLRLELDAELSKVGGLKKLDADVRKTAAQGLAILRARPLALSTTQTSDPAAHAAVESYANSVFAVYAMLWGMGLNPDELPDCVLRPLLLHFHFDGHMNRSHLTTLWLMQEAWVRPRWIGSGYRWTGAALKPHYISRAG